MDPGGQVNATRTFQGGGLETDQFKFFRNAVNQAGQSRLSGQDFANVCSGTGNRGLGAPGSRNSCGCQLRQQTLVNPFETTVAENNDDVSGLGQGLHPVQNVIHVRFVERGDTAGLDGLDNSFGIQSIVQR